MLDDMKQFVRNKAIQSKLSDRPCVGSYRGKTYVFVHGYPMSLRGFYLLATKAILGGGMKLAGRHWEVLHAETRLLCEDLGVELIQNREAFSVIKGIRSSANWTEEHHSKEQVLGWIEDVETMIEMKMGE